MIVGTAGHIDHGKTTLVRAMTGVDTDRLPEERKRGISIELGYAFLDTPQGGRIGFVDVPGHERLVHTMLAGATGIDFALLLVAADDGVMPQTREHLAVVSLLGIARGAVAVTKIDRVDAARVLEVEADARALVAGTSLDGAPVMPVSAQTGKGLDALRQLLFEAARARSARDREGAAFRLAVDRVFTLDGIGTVVTGAVHAGSVVPGDTLSLVPGARSLRVRSLHAQNRPVERAVSGERCAVALAGVEKEAIDRGQWLVAPQLALATERLDARLTLWREETKSLRSGTPVHVHIGSVAVQGTVAVLDGDLLSPGESARVQLVLRGPVGAWHGDRVVLRDASASRTMAGGVVLDPFAPARYRRTPQRLAELDALAIDDPQARLAALLAAAPHGIDLGRFVAAQGCALPPLGSELLRHADASSDWALDRRHAELARAKALAALAAFHDTHPNELGPDAARLRRLAVPRLPESLWRALLGEMQAAQSIAVRGAYVHLPEHGIRLTATEQALAERIAPMLAEAGYNGAWVRDLARSLGESEPLMRVTLARLAQRGELHQVVRDLYYPPETAARLAAIVRDVAEANEGAVTAARFRDATDLGRKRAIQILEYFDRIGLLRRIGDTHRLRPDSTLFGGETILVDRPGFKPGG